tara:strand:- start:61343 stop:61777 length:435 start_codon:yes stop_codon:yes gene_type:complete
LRQTLFLSTNKEEKVVKKIIQRENQNNVELVEDIINYFLKDYDHLIYPAKAYCVALVYSSLLEKYFNIPFYESLNDPQLFQGTMKDFEAYQCRKNIYDQVIAELKHRNLFSFEKNQLDQVKATVSSFHLEFFTENQTIDSITNL